MRKIEREMLDAIHQCKHSWCKDNTFIRRNVNGEWPGLGGTDVYLHGNHIARVSLAGYVRVNFATLKQWPTVTTRSRLTALGVSVRQMDNGVYLDGKYVCPARSLSRR